MNILLNFSQEVMLLKKINRLKVIMKSYKTYLKIKIILLGSKIVGLMN